MRVIVTGASRGLGAEVVRRLTAAGHDAVGVTRTGPGPGLDLADPASVSAMVAFLGATPLDALVANAAIALDGFDADVARVTLRVNLEGTVELVEGLLPALRPGGRVVFVSSRMGELAAFDGPARAAIAAVPDRDGVRALGQRFVAAVAAGDHRRDGWPSSAYSVSKALVNAYARHLAARTADDPRGLHVVAVCPGWVRTRMGGPGAPRSVEQGANGIVWAATAPDVPRTGFFRDGGPVSW